MISLRKITKCMAGCAAICTMVLLCACGGAADELYEKSVTLYEQGSYEEARNVIMEAIKSNPDKAEYYICYGMTLVSLEDYEGAREQFLSVIRDNNSKIARENNKRAYRGIALTYYESGVYDQAKSYFDLALSTEALDEMDNDLKAYKADCDMYLGNYDNSVKMFTDLIENGKGLSDEELTGYYMSRAGAYMIPGNYMAAIEDYKNAIAKDKYCYPAYIGGYIALVNTHDTNAADEMLDKGLELECRNTEDEYYNAILNFYKGNNSDAMQTLVSCRDEGMKEAGYYIGMINQREGKYEEAIECYESYVADVPSGRSAQYCNQLAGCYMELKDYDTAKTLLDEGAEIAVGNIKQELLKNRIIAYEKLGKYKKAKQYAEEYISLYDDSDMLAEYEYIKTRYRKK
ncbi:MAG: tetratricopeptide repeat protein [Lachnospiraceae bacterium]|nr:tetratricopeptide repeat protein [Lachnospiraceae bacterium]